MARTWISIVALAAALAAAVSAGAQTRGGGPAGRAESQVVDLARREAKFRETLDGLSPAVEDVKRILAEGVVGAKGALEDVRRDPSDDNVLRYNSVIANVYRDLSAKFDAIRGQRVAVTAAAADIVKAVERARKDFDATLDLQQRELERREAEAQRRDADLEALADKYAGYVDRNEPMPLDAELEIKEAEIRRDFSAAQARLLRRSQETLGLWKQRLDEASSGLKQMETEIGLVFVKADLSQQVLGTVAGAQKAQIETADVVRRVSTLVRDVDAAHQVFDSWMEAFGDFVAQPPATDPASAAAHMPSGSRRTGLDIIRDIRAKKTQVANASRQ